MYLVKRLTGAAFWICLAGLVGLAIYKLPLPETNDIRPEIINNPPGQKEIKMPAVKMTIKGFDYEITPLFEYEIYGVVVEQYSSDNLLDFYHKTDPANIRDLCLVWGKTIENGAYREVKYSHGEFTCYMEWKKPMGDSFDFAELSNNHLLAKNDNVARMIKKAGIGDQVRIKGWLAEYSVSQKGQLISTRGTSTIRTDMGNNSCETILVTDFEILKEHLPEVKLIKKGLPIAVTVLFILSAGLWFTDIEPRQKVKITIDGRGSA